MEEDQRRNFLNLRPINKVRSQTLCAPPATYIQDDMTIHDFNRAMVDVLIELAQDLVADRLIGNIRLSMTKRGMQQLQVKFTTR